MNTQRQKLAEEIFNGAVACDTSIRDAFIRSRCGQDAELFAEVVSLLRFIEEGEGPLDAGAPPLAQLASRAGESPGILPAGTRIGAYSISRSIGVGGMGVVYVAEQERPRRTVALKLVRPGFASSSVLRRFEFESEVLGRLQHPGIAQIIEAGTADTGLGPQPYFAMEFVNGRSLADYCIAESLTHNEVLSLLLKICDAVEHAHRRGIVHRDLKPGNILVDRAGQPKILDFGIARAAAGADAGELRLTLQGADGRQLVGTLPYMSPEQVSENPSEIDFRCDVYALGVILYELLSGRPPLDLKEMSLPAAVRAISETEPPRLGALNPHCRGDLETIAAKSLEKDPARRYQSAADFAADIVRYLRDEPIAARPASTTYTLRKLARRHRALAAGTILAASALIVGAVSSTVAWRQTRAQRDLALTAAKRSDQVATFLKQLLGGIDPAVAKGRDTAVLQQILATSTAEMASKLTDQPDVEAELRAAIGGVYAKLDLFTQAEEMLRSSLALYARSRGNHTEATALVLRDLAEVRLKLAAIDDAEKLAEQSSVLLKGLYGAADNEHTAAHLQLQARIRAERSDYAAAAALLRNSVAMSERLFKSGNTQLALAYNDLADILAENREFAEAETYAKRALSLQEKLKSRDDPLFLSMLQNYGTLLNHMNRQPESEAALREVLERRRRVLGPDHTDTAATMGSLANTCADQGKSVEAAELLLAQLEIRRRILGNKHPTLATSYNNLGYALLDLKDDYGAEEMFRNALEVDRLNYGEAHRNVGEDRAGIARLLRLRGEYPPATEMQRSAVAAFQQVLEPENSDLAGARAVLADILLESFWKDLARNDSPTTLHPRAQEAESLYRLAQGPRTALKSRPWLAPATETQIGESLVARAATSPIRAEALALLIQAVPLCERGFQGVQAVVAEIPIAIRRDSVRRAAMRLTRLYETWQTLDPDPSRESEARHWREIATTYTPPDPPKSGA